MIPGDSRKMYNVSIEQYIKILGEIHVTPSGRRFVNYWLDMGHVGDFLATYVNMILVVSVYSHVVSVKHPAANIQTQQE